MAHSTPELKIFSGSAHLSLAQEIADQLGLETAPDMIWNAGRSPSRNLERYLCDAALGAMFARSLAVTVTANNSIEPVDGGIVSFAAPTDGASATLLCQWQGPGGDSLGIGYGAIWLTDYHAGTVSRIELNDTLARCKSAAGQ